MLRVWPQTGVHGQVVKLLPIGWRHRARRATRALLGKMATAGGQFSDLRDIKKQLLSVTWLCRERGLLHSVKWASELAFSLESIPMNELPPTPELTESGEKKKDDETVDSLGPLEKGQVKNEALRELRVELSKKHKARELDGFGLYLYGVVLRKLDLVKEALDVFVEATHVLPLHWATWLELCNLITDKEMVKFLEQKTLWTLVW
ncbi:hypothetical protein FKM82_012416 [Ascaphus truei]